jgi:trehalose 6-phosphate synthase/phosphatase
MSKIIIISNRLPVTVKRNGKGLEYIISIGGLSTGLKKFHEEADSLWIGWPGISDEEITGREKRSIEKTLKEKFKCIPVFLTQEELSKYYYGFCNNTIWPLFHYFPSQTEYEANNWEAYKEINQKFYDQVKSIIRKDDIVWVHDYQLMLLPETIKRYHRSAKVGFFLHIPFPSVELIRQLAWRAEILKGLLGADLIGFHTYDYVRHFLSSTRRLLGLDDLMNVIKYQDRYVKVGCFPMGIDFKRFSGDCIESKLCPEVLELQKTGYTKNILSIDRLDYTKGIPGRIRAFIKFLQNYPEYIEKVRLNLIVAPSRTEIDDYEILLKEIRQLISEANGSYGTMNWMPIWFLFKSFSQNDMIGFYRNSDVLLVTPLRDGMNLIAKEYVAARTDLGGMLVLSETAGAANELTEAVMVNANDIDSVARGIRTALELPMEDKRARNKTMNLRLKKYTVEEWAADFLKQLKSTTQDPDMIILPKPIAASSNKLNKAYREAKKRILFLDYDGTLIQFGAISDQGKLDKELKVVLSRLAKDPKNTVVLISGSDKKTLDSWFAEVKGLILIASHGLWFRYPGHTWRRTVVVRNSWIESVRPLFELFADCMPGAIIDEKEFAISIHYSKCNPEIIPIKMNELRETLISMIKSSSLVLQEGYHVLELKDSRVHKGDIASKMIDRGKYDFIFNAGDDFTYEEVFQALPASAFSVKVGAGNTDTKYRMRSSPSLYKQLKSFADSSGGRKNNRMWRC